MPINQNDPTELFEREPRFTTLKEIEDAGFSVMGPCAPYPGRLGFSYG